MKKKVFAENDTRNARIRIEYDKKKPVVSFKYPNKITQKDSNDLMLFYIMSILLLIGIIFLFLYTLFDSRQSKNYNAEFLMNFSKCIASHPLETLVNYTYVKEEICDKKVSDLFLSIKYSLEKYSYLPRLLFLIIPILLSFIVYYPFKKFWNKQYPKVQAFFSSKNLTKFRSSDVREDVENRFEYKFFVELPIFSNVICDFKATKDFSKYMKLFEIKEYNFSYLRKKRVRKRKYRKRNEYLWYARWYFSEKPQKGEIGVIFK